MKCLRGHEQGAEPGVLTPRSIPERVHENASKNFGSNARAHRYVREPGGLGRDRPTTVSRTALQTVVSVAGLLLTSEIVEWSAAGAGSFVVE